MNQPLNFDLKTPCDQCPFRRTALRGWIGELRAREIAGALDQGFSFTCHKTIGAPKEQMCAGALVVLKKSQGGFSGALSVACALRLLDPRGLDLEADVFESLAEFIEHHGTQREPV